MALEDQLGQPRHQGRCHHQIRSAVQKGYGSPASSAVDAGKAPAATRLLRRAWVWDPEIRRPQAPPQGAASWPSDPCGGDAAAAMYGAAAPWSLRSKSESTSWRDRCPHEAAGVTPRHRENSHRRSRRRSNTLPSAAPPNRDTAVMRESPAVPFIGGARGFPAAASGDDERREEGEGVAAAGARVSPPVAWEGGDARESVVFRVDFQKKW